MTLTTPAIASEPCSAEAPSGNTSMRSTASEEWVDVHECRLPTRRKAERRDATTVDPAPAWPAPRPRTPPAPGVARDGVLVERAGVVRRQALQHLGDGRRSRLLDLCTVIADRRRHLGVHALDARTRDLDSRGGPAFAAGLAPTDARWWRTVPGWQPDSIGLEHLNDPPEGRRAVLCCGCLWRCCRITERTRNGVTPRVRCAPHGDH